MLQIEFRACFLTSPVLNRIFRFSQHMPSLCLYTDIQTRVTEAILIWHRFRQITIPLVILHQCCTAAPGNWGSSSPPADAKVCLWQMLRKVDQDMTSEQLLKELLIHLLFLWLRRDSNQAFWIKCLRKKIFEDWIPVFCSSESSSCLFS